MSNLPSTKVIAQAVVTLLLAVLALVDIELPGDLSDGLEVVIGAVIGAVVAYFVPETNPAPSSAGR